MVTIRKNLMLLVFVGLMSTWVLAEEPEENPATRAAIEAAEKKLMMPNEEAKAKLLDAQRGVFSPEYDDNGVLIRLRIKGWREVPRGLSGARGDRIALDNAERDAKAAFVRFLKEEVKLLENARQEVIIIEKDGAERGDFKEVIDTRIDTVAQGQVRGFISLLNHFEGEGENRKATVVFGWSRRLVRDTRTIENDIKNEGNTILILVPRDNNVGKTPELRGTETKSVGDLENF